MAIKLIALDLDFTLLSSDKTISEKNRQALATARAKGVHIVLTTGRPLPAIQHLLEDLDLLGEGSYSITFNGGLVQENTGRIISQTYLNPEDVTTLHRVTRELGLPLDLVSGQDVYVCESPVASLYSTCNPMLHFIPTQEPDVSGAISYNKGLSVCAEELIAQKLPLIPEELYDQFEIFKSRDIILEWCPKGVHKARGLEALIAHLGLVREEVMACGDEENDLTMIEWAGLGVAVANASNLIKERADVVLPVTNDQDAIAYAIEHYVEKGEEDGLV